MLASFHLAIIGWLLVGSTGASWKFPRHRVDDDPPTDNLYETKFFDTYIDNFDPTHTKKFSLKYLINTDFFEDGGPLFFYTGNEGVVEGFAQNTGIMFDIAPIFKALIVFCEHRFYGNGSSMPFGADSFKDIDHAKYLTIEQTLGDFANSIDYLRGQYNFSKVIAFGGSYGGMLSAWFRQKYPKVVDGAWAASAPVAYFRSSGVPLGAFDKLVTENMKTFGCDQDAVVEALSLLYNCTFAELNQAFQTDPRSQVQTKDDIDALRGYIRIGFEYMAMTGYPYPTNFLRPLESWPMLAACKKLGANSFEQPVNAAEALRTAMEAFYGTDPTCFKNGCENPFPNLGDLIGWDWQSCTQIPIDICAQGPPNDVFWVDCANDGRDKAPTFEDSFADACKGLENRVQNYKTDMIQFDYIKRYYGFDLEGASNLILTQGALDPWSAGGATLDPEEAVKNNIFMYTIEGSPHHLDLRTPNSCDPPTVINARYQIVKIIQCWADQTTENCDRPELLRWDLPEWEGPVVKGDCQPLVQQFPWGQTGNPMGSTQSPPTTPSSAHRFGTISLVSIVFGAVLFVIRLL